MEPLARNKVHVPIVALGGDKGLGAGVGRMVGMVASAPEQETIADCGHFLPEERPEAVIRHVFAMLVKTAGQGRQPPATGAAP